MIHKEGCQCGNEICRWANKPSSIPVIPDFEHEWNAAPPARRRYTEQSEAEHWFQRGLWLGIQYERERGLVAMNQDLREMQRIARERMG